MGLMALAADESRANRLLAAMEPTDLELLLPQFRLCALEPGAVLQEQGAPVAHAYFPLKGVISLVSIMGSGASAETACVGREGAIGVFADSGAWNSPTRAVVQLPGTAVSIPTTHLQTALRRREHFRDLVLRYKEGLLAQAQQISACNALHSLDARLARWLLQILDRIDGKLLLVTQETLSQTLGVRRTSVTLVAQNLQRKGVIRYRRGRIEIRSRQLLEAAACECYRTIRHLSDTEGRSQPERGAVTA
jgi:CRP-like cAMP-binding protein